MLNMYATRYLYSLKTDQVNPLTDEQMFKLISEEKPFDEIIQLTPSACFNGLEIIGRIDDVLIHGSVSINTQPKFTKLDQDINSTVRKI